MRSWAQRLRDMSPPSETGQLDTTRGFFFSGVVACMSIRFAVGIYTRNGYISTRYMHCTYKRWDTEAS